MTERADIRGGAPAAAARPLLRGRFHQAAFVAALPAGYALLRGARGAGPAAVAACAVYAATLCLLFGVSATYHRGRFSPRVRAWWQRADHSMIYVFIAGSYTPVCLLRFRTPFGITLLAAVWVGAIAGVVLRLATRERLGRLRSALYLVLGWLLVLGAPVLVPRLSLPVLLLLAGGGVLYTVGAIGFFRHRPDPFPRVFGYHEIWHLATVGAASLHYAAIFLVARRPL